MSRYTPNPDELATIYPEAIRAWISGPSIVSPDEEFSLRVSLLRIDGYPAADFTGTLAVRNNTGIRNLPEQLEFSRADQGSRLIQRCSIAEEGIHRFRVSPLTGFSPAGQSHPIWVRRGFPYRLFWGDLHVHSVHGRCQTPYMPKSPDYGYWYAREVLGHDFCAMADHATALNDETWQQSISSLKRWHTPGEFVAILGFEGDYDGEDGGHFNFYFPSDHGVHKSFRLRFGGTLKSMFAFAREHDALAICHHSSRSVRGRDFSRSYWGGQDIEPVMEVYSQFGSSEEYASSRPTVGGRHPGQGHYYRYALRHGFRLGMIGGSDSHCTTAGGPVPMVQHHLGGKIIFPYPGGVAAVYARELTREALFAALRARRCYAASLEKILLWVEANGAPMGSEIAADSAEIRMLISCAQGRLIEVLVVKNGEVAACFGEHGNSQGFDEEHKTFQLDWRDENFSGESCYYVRATHFDGDLVWSSPIWIRPD